MNPLTHLPIPFDLGPLDSCRPKLCPGDSAWHYSPLYIGQRALLHLPSRSAWDEQGAPTQAKPFTPLFEHAADTAIDWLDAIVLPNGAVMVLDLPPQKGRVFLPAQQMATLEQRLVPLRVFFDEHLPHKRPLPQSVHLAYVQEMGETDARAFYARLSLFNDNFGLEHLYRGVLARNSHAIYPLQLVVPGLKCPGWEAHPFST